MMNKIMVIGVIFILLFSGCVVKTEVSQLGATVRPVTANEKEKICTFITIVEGSGAPLSGGMQSAMAEARNKIGSLGGNGMYIISMRSDPYRGVFGMECCHHFVTAEALRCNFQK